MAEKALTDAELIAVRAILAMTPAPDPVKDAARKAAWDAVDARQVKLRADDAALDRLSPTYTADHKALIAIGDPEVAALVTYARSL